MLFNSIIPTKKKWKSWKMPTRLGYLASLVVIITFIISLFDFNSKVDSIQHTSNEEGDIIYVEENKEAIVDFNYEFQGRLANLGEKVFDFETNKFKRDLSIKIDYSGSYTALFSNSETVNYSGGNLIIKIEKCYLELSDFSIPPLGPAPKNILIQQVEERFKTLVFRKKDLILKRTKLCLKDFL